MSQAKAAHYPRGMFPSRPPLGRHINTIIAKGG